MEKLIQKILMLGALLGMGFGAYAYLTEKPTTVVGKLEAKLETQIDKIYETMEARRAERDAHMEKLEQRMSAKVEQSTKQVMERLEKIDDRLYEMQRRQLDSSAGNRNDFDGG